MEVSFAEHLACARAVGRVEGFLDAVQDLEGSFLEFHDALKNVCETGDRFIRTARCRLLEDPSDAELRYTLAGVSVLREGILSLMSRRVEWASRKPDMVARYWSDELHDQLVDLEDGLDDMEETVALRLSAEFQSEVSAALEEAREEKAASRTPLR